jgi:hypothetical protein
MWGATSGGGVTVALYIVVLDQCGGRFCGGNWLVVCFGREVPQSIVCAGAVDRFVFGASNSATAALKLHLASDLNQRCYPQQEVVMAGKTCTCRALVGRFGSGRMAV